ncbi:hypothetical protein CHGG_09640 [Chaetomium globosum CBS 148.51]|uniref:Uncharacterized protein n=1 Tax=Chaetomium globosum (strain ATCC 6205 / CBS 148.51 / DSM 1962 / NBRC 6347 / NRRL 1970) TaxID=306901 RepID=Q2GQW4_CHAGB|nr:uncharacterized protein CHGG_09640 [Chaetomium globosum CBS 148.51]EAQ83236.1 hypothetical protein CHGG_09640 [Chaetomium globosum CBS 148.51]
MDNTPTSINIPEQRHRPVKAEAGSSPSSYSSSPSSPEPSPKTPSRASHNQKPLHSRRPSLLSSSPTSLPVKALSGTLRSSYHRSATTTTCHSSSAAIRCMKFT